VVEAKLLEHIKTPFQVMDVYENKTFGKFFTLDNWMQYTEKDEFIYQEMLVHPAFAINSNIKNVLVIGGGDGGIVREVCKYKGVKHIDWIDIDGKVVEVCGKYFPSTAYTDKRVNFMAIDGIDWVKKSNSSKYDLVIVDSSDPDDTDSGAVLAASTLFTKEFYLNCKRILTKNGILTCQGESPYYEGDRRNLLRSYNMLKNTFPKNYLCEFFLPTYASGYFTSGYATKTFSPFKINAKK
jgi:spermidine synthase